MALFDLFVSRIKASATEMAKNVRKNWKPSSDLRKRFLLPILLLPFMIFTGLNADI